MKLLIICGQLYPTESNNSTLLSKLLPVLQRENELRIVATCRSGTAPQDLPEKYHGIRVDWVKMKEDNPIRLRLLSAYSKLVDKNGHSDAIHTCFYRKRISQIYREWRFSALLSISEPYSAAISGSKYSKRSKTAVYIMDPPPSVRGEADTPYRTRGFRKILKRYDTIVSTPFFYEALSGSGFQAFRSEVLRVGFPIITEKTIREPNKPVSDRISLLFTGWMYSGIRSPKYFLDVLSRLDERFVVTFMGKECTNLRKHFDVQTKAELITLPQQPYEKALQAMADADILINIGNSVPVHMPSKTLEYINTGKPMVNFYKMDDCPTLYYTKRYPLCLNLSEQDPDIDAAAQRFIDFCNASKGKTVDRAYIEAEYADCTPEYIAQKILDALKES